MPAKLHAIDPEPIDPSVITKLTELLEEALAGNISSVSMAWVMRDGRVGSTWSLLPNKATMFGAVARLMHRLQTANDEEEAGA